MDTDVDHDGHPAGWTGDMSVGIDAIDDDHQGFFRLAELIHSINNRPAQNQSILIRTAINMLGEYVGGHFLREEMAMEAVGYAFLEDHRAAHQAFSERVHQISSEYKAGNTDLPLKSSSRLK